MKKLTINHIKDILRSELEKSKRHVQHYYLGTDRFSETDRLKSILNNQEQEDQFKDKLKQDYRQTLKEINPKVHQVLEEQGYDPVKVDSLEEDPRNIFGWDLPENLPVTFIIGTDGKLKHRLDGPQSYEGLVELLKLI